MGYGNDPASFDTAGWAHGAASFGPSLRLIAEAIGLPLDAVDATGEVAVARRRSRSPPARSPAGTVAAQRMIVSGLRGGEPLLTFRANWYCTTELEPEWDLRADRLAGQRSTATHRSTSSCASMFPLDRMAETTPGLHREPRVNAVAVVCAAAPGHPHDARPPPGRRQPRDELSRAKRDVARAARRAQRGEKRETWA